MPTSTSLLGCFALFAVSVFLLANYDLATTLSPQGCRMSYMSPSYVLQDGFNTSWSNLSRRYTLWLYREVGWDLQAPSGLPVLFIPGNAGSSHQVRSIASSASRQYYISPGRASTDFVSRGISPLDIYTVEFNEDLSAFHGTTLQSQIEYTSKAVDYILSQYPPNTPLAVLGHSMGGIIATAMLPSDRISAIITMSSPHTLPPARFDPRVDDIYEKNRQVMENDTTPILSLCGGATDMMIPSESCILPSLDGSVYHRTVFTSSLEGVWTGVGHREMVWCHQVRWRVARALLELAPQQDLDARKAVLDEWLRDGHKLPPGTLDQVKSSPSLELSDPSSYEIISPSLQLVQKPVGAKMFLLPIPETTGKEMSALSVLVGKGSVFSFSPQIRHSLDVSVYTCSSSKNGSGPNCTPLSPNTLKLMPQPNPGEPFPHPRLESDPYSGGADESDGVVLYQADIHLLLGEWIGLKVMNGDGEGWIAAGFNHKGEITNMVSTTSLLFHKQLVEIDAEGALRLDLRFPRLLSHALVVYRLTPHAKDSSRCTEFHLAPLLIHTSNSVETHYYSLASAGNRSILLHTHYPAPYHVRRDGEEEGIHLVIYSSGMSSCIDYLKRLDISIDWPKTLGRLSSRYITTIVAWAAGASFLNFFFVLGSHDRGAPMPSVSQSMRHYGIFLWRFMLPASVFASLLPWPQGFYLGLDSSGFFAPLAPFILLISSGLVIVVWWILKALLWMSRPVARIFGTRKHNGLAVGRSTVISMCIIFAMIFFLVPWQVAFLGCWIYQFMTCATAGNETFSAKVVENRVQLDSSNGETADHVSRSQTGQRRRDQNSILQDNYELNCHLLLLMTWLLPLAAPALAVWVRTLNTAGLTTPFDGDHFFWTVAPFLLLVDFSSRSATPIFIRQKFEDRISARWTLVLVAVISFLVGGTRPHKIYDTGRISIALLVTIRIGRRYWGGASWTATEI